MSFKITVLMFANLIHISSFIKLIFHVRRLDKEFKALFRRTMSSLSFVFSGRCYLLLPPPSKVKSVNLRRIKFKPPLPELHGDRPGSEHSTSIRASRHCANT